MIELLVQLLVLLIILGIVWYVGNLLIGLIPMEPAIKQIATIILAVIILLAVLYELLPLIHMRIT